MHGKGTFIWSDGRKYIGEVSSFFNYTASPSMSKIKKMVSEFSNGQMAENMKDNG